MKQILFVIVAVLFSSIFSISTGRGFSLVKPVDPFHRSGLAKVVLERPQTDTSIVSPSGFFRIHFDTSGINVPEYDINEFALAADSSLNVITNTFGFLPPPDDNGHGGDNLYDIYILHVSEYCETDFDSLLPSGAYTTYCIVNNKFDSYFYTHGIDAARISVAHSITHAVTVGNYPFNEGFLFYYEITAEAMEEFVFDSVNDYYYYLDQYFNHPHKSLSQYSGYDLSIWNIYLRDRLGDSIIKRIWDFTVSNNIFDAMDAALIERGSTLEDEFSNFGIWTYYTNTRTINGQYFEEAANYPLLNLNTEIDITSPETTINISTLPYSNNIILLHDNRSGYQSDILTVICNHDKINAVGDPNFNLDVEYHFLTFDDSNSVKISDNYWYHIVSSANENIRVLHLINDQLTRLEDKVQDLAYRLIQNYPNPFNPSTKIKYSVPHLTKVIVNVFDILGRVVVTLVKEEKQAGTYEITWNATGLPGGVYFYQLRAGNFTQTKKMILLK